jgi:two-component system, sensor histidine kinase LadS
MKHGYFQLFFFFLLAFRLSAQQPVLQADTLSHKQIHQLSNFLEVLADETNLLGIDNILQTANQKRFLPLDKDASTQGNITYWLKFRLRSVYFRQTEWIVLPNTFGAADEIELYAINPYNVYIRKLGGLKRKAAQVEFGSRYRTYLSFSLGQDSLPTTVYLKVRNLSQSPPILTYRIGEKSAVLEKSEQIFDSTNIQQGIFQGMLWVILIYNLLLYFSVREKSYLYYALYLLGASLYFLFRNNFLIYDLAQEYPHFFSVCWFGSIGLTSVLYYVFMRSFFNTAQNHKAIDKLLRYGIYLQSIVMSAAVLSIAINQDSFWALRLVFFPSILQILLSSYILYRLRTEGGKIAKYFVRGSAVLLLSVVIYNIIFFSVVQFRLIEVTTFNVGRLNVLIEAGVVIEILFFSYGLGRKMQLADTEKRVIDRKLIFQLRENERLQSQVNQELESKVAERTLKLNETIEELNSTLQLVNSQKKEIEEKRENIMASINYAKRIQTAMMPTEAAIRQTLPQSFVLFRPCDIVSGDFYYFAETIDKVIIAAIDCTGHGVPGAFMSMIGNDMLNEIINIKNIYEADHILNHLHAGVRKALKQQETDNKDGMDLALLVLHKVEKTLPNFQEIGSVSCVEYAGAMNPLWLCDDKGQLHEIKANKRPIGGSLFHEENDRVFGKHLICLQSPTTSYKPEISAQNLLGELHLQTTHCTFYLSTDGYQDQFGGTQNKKFMPRRLRELLVKLQDQPMERQKQSLENNFTAWLGSNEQIDDVLLLGLKVRVE